MDQALRAVADGRLDDAEGLLDALRQDNRLARRPGDNLIEALRAMAAELSILSSPVFAPAGAAPGTPASGGSRQSGLSRNRRAGS